MFKELNCSGSPAIEHLATHAFYRGETFNFNSTIKFQLAANQKHTLIVTGPFKMAVTNEELNNGTKTCGNLLLESFAQKNKSGELSPEELLYMKNIMDENTFERFQKMCQPGSCKLPSNTIFDDNAEKF